jgi:hypothetical protein
LKEIENNYDFETILEKEIKEKVFHKDNLNKYYKFMQGDYDATQFKA